MNILFSKGAFNRTKVKMKTFIIVTVLLVCPGWPPDVFVCLFEHMACCLLLVPCALLSNVWPRPSCYFIIVSVTPPVSSSLSLLVCLPIYSPGVCSPVLFGCLMSDVTSCVCVISACLLVFLPRGCFCFFLLLKKPTFSCTWVLASSLFTQQDKNVTKDSYFISCSFELWTVTKSAISTKIWSSTTVFNTNNNKEYSWSSILEWFLKDQVIIKTGVMIQIKNKHILNILT